MKLSLWILFALTFVTQIVFKTCAQKIFEIDYTNDVFLLRGRVFRYIAGSIHYFRIPKIYWEDRIAKAKAMGVNAIQFYIPWNFHEAKEGRFRFDADRDIEQFLNLIKKYNLYAILRPGPYICAEWDFGGLPAWLLKKNSKMVIRSSDKEYLEYVKSWFDRLLPRLQPYLVENNGPILMTQVENEYGSYYTCDKMYLEYLHDLIRKYFGQDHNLFTTDGNSLEFLKCGALDNRTFHTVDFGIGQAPEKAFAPLRKIQPHGPLVNSEFYSGWLDIWGVVHQTVSTSSLITSLKAILNYASNSTSINFYMLHGGTNFEFWNGAEQGPPIQPQVTSYDYDAPISETGDTGFKYQALRQLLSTFSTDPLPPVPLNITKFAYGQVLLEKRSSILSYLKAFPIVFETEQPITMEDADQNQGLMVYLTKIKPAPAISELRIRVADKGYTFLSDGLMQNNQFVGEFNETNNFLTLPELNSFQNLVIIAENLGHVNFGSGMFQNVKGVIDGAYLNSQLLSDWIQIPIDLLMLKQYFQFTARPPTNSLPKPGSMHFGTFFVHEAFDTFIKLDNFSKGFVMINDNLVGRYWNSRGPQRTLYVPKSMLLTNNTNSVFVLELEDFSCKECSVSFLDEPILDGPVFGRMPNRFFDWRRHQKSIN